MITVYVKTHRKTGLRYLGYTRQKDVCRYRGSGKHWVRHVKKHGYDVDTEIVAIFENIEEATAFTLKFSKDHNIVEFVEWANLQEETCLDGLSKGFHHSEETKEKIGKPRRGIPRPDVVVFNTGRKHPPRSSDYREKQSKIRKSDPKYAEHCRNIGRDAAIKRKGIPNDKVAKNWMVTKNGDEIMIKNLANFCKINGLNEGHMRSVAKGRRKQHKGWKCKEL